MIFQDPDNLHIVRAVGGVCPSGPCLKLFNLYIRSIYTTITFSFQVCRCPGTEIETVCGVKRSH